MSLAPPSPPGSYQRIVDALIPRARLRGPDCHDCSNTVRVSRRGAKKANEVIKRWWRVSHSDGQRLLTHADQASARPTGHSTVASTSRRVARRTGATTRRDVAGSFPCLLNDSAPGNSHNN